MPPKHLKHGALTEKILGCFYTVYNRLGPGFLEKVYENALVIELQKQGLAVRQQAPIHVFYDDHMIGEYFADVIVEDTVILELKVAEAINEAHLAQLMNYLKATRQEVELLLNFGPKPTFGRRIFDIQSNRPNRKRSV